MKEQKIRALTEREKCRSKIHVWFGSADNYYHPVREVVANAIDEINNNFEIGDIEVYLSDDNKTITVKDTGRGMPLPEKSEDGTEYWQLLFLTLFAGGKYDNLDDEENVGTNGCGNTVICYTSDYFECTSEYKGKKYNIKFNDGGTITEKLTEKGSTKNHGTSISFSLSKEVYTDNVFDEGEIEEICKRFAVCCKKVNVTFNYKETKNTYHYNSIEEYFDEITNNLTSGKQNGKEATFETDEINTISIVFASSSEPVQEVYLNNNYLKDGGAINNGLLRGIKEYINSKLPAKDAKVTEKDVEDSISLVCKFSSSKVSYANQTKFATNKLLYGRQAKNYIYQLLEVLETENKKEFDKIKNHILEVNKFNNKSDKNKRELQRKLTERIDGVRNRVANLDDCKIHDERSEIYICEGLSAKGSILFARDAVFQAAFALKGKLKNCLKGNYNDILSSKVIEDLIKILGCGIVGDKKHKEFDIFDIKKLRYNSIFIACDADEDGKQIECLLLTFFYRFMQELVEKGKIYCVRTPLYEIKLKNDDIYYAFSEIEQQELVKKYGKEIDVVARAKGLGELDAEDMARFGVKPETRNVIQVTMKEAEAADKAFTHWMGSNVDYRRNFINNHLKEYLELD